MPRFEDVDLGEAEGEADDGSRRPVRTRIEILHQDDDLLVLSKPPGVWVEDSPDELPSVVEQLEVKGLASTAHPPQFIFPLEADISGAVLAARTPEMAEKLRGQAETGALGITCLALVRGPVMHNEGEKTLHLSVAPGGGGRLRVDGNGKAAQLTWRMVDRFIGFALLECRIQPPIPQQARPLLEAAGLPLAVDSLYGGASELRLSTFKAGYRPSKRHPERPLIERVSMHVHAVECVHPRSEKPLRLQSPPPKDFRAAVHQLERFGRMPSS